MEYKNCPLYALKSKTLLKKLLHINNPDLIKQSYIASLVEPYIDHSPKDRLIEPPKQELKLVQKQIKNLLGEIIVPDNIFSGIKKRSYIDNAKFHIGSRTRNLYKIDLTAFFPSIHRDTVYSFFKDDLRCSPDVARILTDLTTIDLSKSNARDLPEIHRFLETKKVSCYNHLISGAPTSQILSYLVNHKMFDEMQALADANNIVMTVYVDDVTFSSENWISQKFRNQIIAIATNHGYLISQKKVKLYTKLYPKLVTGVVIDKNGTPIIKNSLRNKIIIEHTHLRKNPEDTKSRDRLKGLLIAARQLDPNAFPTIFDFVYNKNQT